MQPLFRLKVKSQFLILNAIFLLNLIANKSLVRRSKVELVLSFGSQFSEFIFIFSGSEF